MGFTCAIDSREFDEALRLYRQASRRDLAYILNRAAKNIAFTALKFTPKADRHRIESLLPVAKYIILKRCWRAGKDPRKEFTSRAAIETAAKKMVNTRLKSIGFLKSGWLPAIRGFTAVVREAALSTGSIQGVRQFGRDKGSYSPARDGDSPQAALANFASGKTAHDAQALLSHGEPALQAAVSAVAADMRQWAEQRLAETARKFSAR